MRGLERSVLKFAGMKPVRETLLGTVDAVSDAKRQVWPQPYERLGKASHMRAVRTFAIFTCRAVLPRRENGLEDLKMALSLGFWHFQPTT